MIGKNLLAQGYKQHNNHEQNIQPTFQLKDNINPTHYKGSVQPIDLIDENELNFSRGCIIKYVCRAKKKGTELEDLKKAQYYLNREIEILENKNK